MDLKGAKKKVLNEFPGYEISKSYSGTLGDDSVFGFIVGNDYDNHFVVVYFSGELREIPGPIAGSIARSLNEVM